MQPDEVAELSDHPTTPGRSRADRRRNGLLEAGIDPGRRAARGARPAQPPARPTPVEPPPLTRPRPPAPPAVVPAAPAPTAAAGPRTTVAPFQAVPTPGPTEHPSAPLPDVSDLRSAGPGAPAPADRPWLDEPLAPEHPAGRGRTPVTGPPVQPGGPGAAYRDWTRPSGPGGEVPPATTAIPDRGLRAAAPATEAIPDRLADPLADPAEPGRGAGGDPASGPATGPGTGVVGGRAAFRAERQAAEAERRRAARRSGASAARPDDGERSERPAGRGRTAVGLLAVVVVALLVLGVYSYTSPATQEAGGRQASSAPATSAPVTTSGALPPLAVDPLPPVEPLPATPVREPVTVLNATAVTGLAADIAAVLGDEGWPSAGVGTYEGEDVPVTTVYITSGDEAQRQSALQLIEAHPEVRGPAPRFFEVPGVPDPGLVVVAAGEWRP